MLGCPYIRGSGVVVKLGFDDSIVNVYVNVYSSCGGLRSAYNIERVRMSTSKLHGDIPKGSGEGPARASATLRPPRRRDDANVEHRRGRRTQAAFIF